MTDPLRVFHVDADPETGEWHHATLQDTGTTAERAAFLAQPDTAAFHFDTFERPDDAGGETCLVRVRWVS